MRNASLLGDSPFIEGKGLQERVRNDSQAAGATRKIF
jgi:hypothetical protein